MLSKPSIFSNVVFTIDKTSLIPFSSEGFPYKIVKLSLLVIRHAQPITPDYINKNSSVSLGNEYIKS